MAKRAWSDGRGVFQWRKEAWPGGGGCSPVAEEGVAWREFRGGGACSARAAGGEIGLGYGFGNGTGASHGGDP